MINNTPSSKFIPLLIVTLLLMPTSAHAQFQNNIFTRAVSGVTSVYQGLAAYSQNLFGSYLGASGEGTVCSGQSTFFGIGSAFCGAAATLTGSTRQAPPPTDDPPTETPCTPGDSECPTDTPANQPPTTPSIIGSGACVINTPYTVILTSTDPDGDGIHYIIDWDASVDSNGDGIANNDENTYVPASGYAASGIPISATHTYSTEGPRTIRVRAQDSTDLYSAWTSFTFTCTDASGIPPGTQPGGTLPQCSDGLDNGDGDGLVDWGIGGDPDCSSASDTSEFTFTPGSGDGSGISIRPVTLSIEATPVVRRGSRARVSWTATGVSSCARVSGSNGVDSFGHLVINSTFMSPIGGINSSPLFETTTYTLRCFDDAGLPHTDTATVRLQPRVNEI